MGCASVDEVKSIQCASSKKTEDSSELKRIECSSSLIPGALVVDPLVRDMVQEGGMRVTENAIWLRVMAMKEHTKNILKNAILHKEAVEKGQIPSRTLHYPKVLAGNTKNNAKHDSTQGKTSAPSVTQQQEAKNKTRLTSLAVYAGATSMPVGAIGAFGGSVSR
jgi:hypothetical protein